MIAPIWIALGIAAVPGAALAQAAPPRIERHDELIIRQRVIIRVPTRETQMPPAIRWREVKMKKCLPARSIAAAALVSSDTVDFVMPGGMRVRAQLAASCPALDYYRGFYLRPEDSDGMICAGRDVIHARSGGECQIRRFRRLVPERAE